MNIAVIGYGYWGPNLLRNFAETPGANVVWCVDKRPERCELARKRQPGVAVSDGVEEVFEDRRVDAVAIAAPVATHYALARLALESGKHVLVEKPMTRTVAEGEELVALARKTGLVLMVGPYVHLHGRRAQNERNHCQGRPRRAVLLRFRARQPRFVSTRH